LLDATVEGTEISPTKFNEQVDKSLLEIISEIEKGRHISEQANSLIL